MVHTQGPRFLSVSNEMRKIWMETIGEYVSELLHVRAEGEDSILLDDHAERWSPRR